MNVKRSPAASTSRNHPHGENPAMEEESYCNTTAKLHSKLARVVSRHDQLKASFKQLSSHIRIGLIEAQDVFGSLAVPLMKLVGLKSDEMAEDGKSTTFFFTTDLHLQANHGSNMRSNLPTGSSSLFGGEYELQKFEEDYTARATVAGKELIAKQKLQLTQLVGLLKQIESCINSSQNNIFQTIDDHKVSIRKVFEKSINYVSVVQQSSQNSCVDFIMLKLLKAIYDHIRTVLSSVEGGVENLVNELAEQMCMPMVQYVKNIKAEMITGTCPRLLLALEEVGGAARDGRLKLEQARKMVRIEEQMKLDALRRLKESEENTKKMREQLAIFLEAKTESNGYLARKKLLGSQEENNKDNDLLWELLQKKRKLEQPESPSGPKELFSTGNYNKRSKATTTTTMPAVSCRPNTRHYLKSLGSKTPTLSSSLPSGTSPSVSLPQLRPRRHPPR